jgi:hypothetical protein
MKLLKYSLSALGLILLNATVSSACSCNYPSVEDGFRKADAVFSGRVSAASRGEYTFIVERTWKGVSAGRVTVRDVMTRTSCETRFKPGERYLIFASTSLHDGPAGMGPARPARTAPTGPAGPADPTLYLLTCNHNSRWRNAGNILTVIGKGRPVRSGRPRPPRTF